MKRSINKTAADNATADTSVEAVEAVTGAVEGSATATAEFDAATDAARDPYFATFNVVGATILNSPARKSHGEAVEFRVTRQRKGSYIASLGEHEGRESRKVDVAIRRAIEASGGNVKEFTFDGAATEAEVAPMPETAGDNVAEVWFFDEESEISSRLKAVEGDVLAADAKLKGAAIDTRDGWLGFGSAYNAAKGIFAEASLEIGGDNKRGNTAWGIWLRSRFAGSDNVEKILASKNGAAQAGFYASAPAEVVEAYPSVNTASTFERKTNEAVAVFAAATAQVILAARKADGNDDVALDVAEAAETAARVHARRVTEFNKAFEAWQAEAAAKGKAEKPIPRFEQAGKAAENAVIGWLIVARTDKVNEAIAKAWDAEVNAPTDEEKAETEAKAATAKIVKKFAEMDVETAARHLLAILVSHGEPEMVLGALGDMLEDALKAKADKAEADKAAAEKAATEGTEA